MDTDLPDAWRPIAEAAVPADRAAAALALWNPALLELLPGFAAALRTRLTDVRMTGPGLVYTLRADDGTDVAWTGHDPRTFREPRFFSSFPEPLREFLTGVHAGFASDPAPAFGFDRPAEMMTIAEIADYPEGIPDWMDDADIESTRLLRLTSDGGILFHCLSPDLPVGQVALVYEGDVDPQDFGPVIDGLLTGRLTG